MTMFQKHKWISEDILDNYHCELCGAKKVNDWYGNRYETAEGVPVKKVPECILREKVKSKYKGKEVNGVSVHSKAVGVTNTFLGTQHQYNG